MLRDTTATRFCGAPGTVEAITVTVKLATAVSDPSDAVSVIVEAPSVVAPAVETVIARLVPAPPSTTPAAGTTAVFDDDAETDTAVPSGSLTLKAIGPDDTPPPGSKSVRLAGTSVNTGARFDADEMVTVATLL